MPSSGTTASGRPNRLDTNTDGYVRVNVNGRVSAVDANTGRQLHHLGELRRRGGAERFLLATGANGFFTPVDEAVAGRLRDLDGIAIEAAFPEERLVAEITARLGIA